MATDVPAPTLEEILVPNTRPLELRYQEKKTLAILDHSLTSRGRLRFIPPDTLVREVEDQQNRIYRIEGNQITVSQDGRVLRQLNLRGSPALAGFATTLRALLAADVETLKDQYELTLSGTSDAWLLQLAPRAKPLSRLIVEILVEGGPAGIREVRTHERSGNHTRMAIVPDD